eukprot:CFRG3850T1
MASLSAGRSAEINRHGFISRRSTTFSTHGMVASSQPLATEVGLSVLKQGGNAVDAAVAVAATLNVTEPCSTGVGGDCFILFYDAKERRVKALNGSGRAPQKLSLESLRAQNKTYLDAADSITVPGAVAAWVDCVEKWGSRTLTLAEILQPAIAMAEGGFPVHEVAAASWKKEEAKLRTSSPNGAEMLMPNGHAPEAGELMFMPGLARTLTRIGQYGKAGFYEGYVAQSIVDVISNLGGVMELEDLRSHKTDVVDPIKLEYKGVEVWECPPNGQGLAALMALNIVKHFDLQSMGHNSSSYLHVLIEAMRYAFADARKYIADPTFVNVPVEALLSEAYGRDRAALIDLGKANADVIAGQPLESCDTVYFAVTDGDGNSCSFIQSNYESFGSGVVPRGCGFTLQNRGQNFCLDALHPNCLQPGKRPYHTIIPSMVTRSGELWFTFGVMGGFMQPQGHLQTFLNMVEFGMLPQNALDAGRFCIFTGEQNGDVYVEGNIGDDVIVSLQGLGHTAWTVNNFESTPMPSYSKPSVGNATSSPHPHKLNVGREIFGKGQIIERKHGGTVLCGGSDPRGDGLALGW